MTVATTAVLADIGIGPIHIPTPGDLVTALKNAVVDVADTVFTKITEWVAGLLADAVSKVTEALVALLRTVKPSLSPGGAITDALPIQQSVLGLAAALLVVFYLFRIIHGLLTGQVGQNLRATLVDLPMVVVGTLFFGFLCYTLLTLIDAFSDPMIEGFATTLNTTVTALYSQDGLVKGGLFVFIFALLYIAAAIFLCFELFVRSSLIYLVVMFAPLAIATRVWGPTRSYARKATETAVALIFSKLAIAVTLATGASLLNGAITNGGTVEMIQGSAILLLAAFMPFALLRVIPIMEGAVAGEGVARGLGAKIGGAGYAATKTIGAASTPVTAAASAVRSRWETRTNSTATGGGGAGTDPGSDTNGPAGGGSGAGPNPAGGAAPGPATPTRPSDPSGGGTVADAPNATVRGRGRTGTERSEPQASSAPPRMVTATDAADEVPLARERASGPDTTPPTRTAPPRTAPPRLTPPAEPSTANSASTTGRRAPMPPDGSSPQPVRFGPRPTPEVRQSTTADPNTATVTPTTNPNPTPMSSRRLSPRSGPAADRGDQ